MKNQDRNCQEQVSAFHQETENLTYKGDVRNRLYQLMEMSQDPFYDRYLAQMLQDLDSGRATPAQVEKEARRSYKQYQERMAQKIMAQVHRNRKHQPVSNGKNSVEFKIGALIFGFLGAAFILAAFVMLGFNFLDRIMVMTLTLFIALVMFLISRKKDSPAICIVSLIGCYISFWPIDEFETEFNFLIATVILFAINMVSIFLKSKKCQRIIDLVHVFLNMLFSAIFISAAWQEGLNPSYLIFYVATSFAFYSILSLKRDKEENNLLFAFDCIGSGICIFMLFLIGNMAAGALDQQAALFIRLLAEILILAVCGVVFLLWNKADGRKWVQIYYIAGTVLLMSLMASYPVERILSVLFLLFLGKVLAGQKQMQVLDCIVVTWTGLIGLWVSDYWYCWLFAGALLLSAFRIKSMHIYHEIIITLSILAIWWSQCEFYFSKMFGIDRGWLYPVSVGILLFLFLLFNHFPKLKNEHQKIYNITNVVFMLGYYLGVWLCDDYIFSSIMMVLGVITIILVFRKRYEMAVPRKDLIIAGFLIYFSVTGHYDKTVVISILLMATALFCVGAGFKMQDKKERVCGLILAFCVCVKLVLYDFREVEVLYRMTAFFVVGVIALVISYIYIQLEKSVKHKQALEEGRTL